MIGVALALKAGGVAWLAAAVFSTVDPVWATPLNTLLLLLTLVVGYALNRKVNRVEDKAHAIHVDVGAAASAAASAAEAAAASARIAKELGGAIRHVDTPIATGTTGTTGEGA